MLTENKLTSLLLVKEKLEDTVRRWGPIQILLDDGFPDTELSVMVQAIAETLSEYTGPLQHHDSIVSELEDFVFTIMEEHGVYLEEDVLGELSKKIIKLHNSHVRAQL
ncbi:hypothetical protein NECID01_1075 [Nematocida sp. AWRm77]|nr:hypothetical protein NECID01_1075 [Nematocida sp. AWRm77]